MTQQEKCRLTWNTFESHTKDLLGGLLLSSSFSDVTLVCEDGKSIESHQFILSSCSNLLRQILSGLNESESHPLVILNGVHHQEMETLLQFMYRGEATFYQDRLNDLLKVAKHLEVKNISENFNIPENEEEHSKEDDRLDPSEQNDYDIPEFDFENDSDVIKAEAIKMEAESPKKNNDSMDTSMNKSINELVKQGKQHTAKGVRFVCNQCDYQATKQNHLKVHIQSQHEGIRYSCNYCDYQATNQSNLKAHTQSKHEGVRHPCPHCDYQAKNKSHLKVHVQSQHEGVRYQCDQCEYQTTAPELLRIHRKSVHEGIQYSCDKCSFIATTKSRLTQHNKSQHENVRFYCNLCDNSYKEKKTLKKHMIAIHNMVTEELEEREGGSDMMAISMPI